jgi:hypothetical protein
MSSFYSSPPSYFTFLTQASWVASHSTCLLSREKNLHLQDTQ